MDEELDPAVERMLDRIRASRGRVTHVRKVLVQALVSAEGHETADSLVGIVQASVPSANRSTIYRNLDELEQMGLVVHAHLGHGPASYHLAPAAHTHLVCRSCRTEIEMPREWFAELAERAWSRYHFRVEPFHFAVLGRCESCASSPVKSDQLSSDPSRAVRIQGTSEAP